jgi:hypothetical protein
VSRLTTLVILPCLLAVGFSKHVPEADRVVAGPPPGVLWRYPSDLASRDLFYGPGGRRHEPHGPFTFLKEDLNGTNPKIVVHDEAGVEWGVKLGAEARPETVSSRLVWAVGYFADEDYFASEIYVRNMPARLHRGQKLVGSNGSLPNVRLKRYSQGDERMAGHWEWRENPFTGTRELNGLRVMMALINNWDMTDENTAIHERTRGSEVVARTYLVGDLGSSFGSAKLTWPLSKARGNLPLYSHSKFIEKVTPDYVDFHAPAGASLFFLATPREFVSKRRLRWIGRQIPREDAKWIGQLLKQLSSNQVRDAFRAAGYAPPEVESFAEAVERRVRALTEL